jgi:hypothetical protein
VRNATDEEHDWEEGEIVEKVMWAKWRGSTRLIWVHKIIKQVQGGWKIEMRETMRNSKVKRIKNFGRSKCSKTNRVIFQVTAQPCAELHFS